jgi:hypothetical protein
MSATEQQVRMAARLYEMRDAARKILGDDYQARMKEYGDVLTTAAKASGKSELAVATTLAKCSSPMAVVFLMAAAVELTEPAPGLSKEK